jgi:hypothetical protein
MKKKGILALLLVFVLCLGLLTGLRRQGRR